MEQEPKYGEPLFHKGYVIIPQPYELADNKGWRSRISIMGQQFDIEPLTGTGPCTTKDEAYAACYQIGKGIIDGVIPGCSLDKLQK